MENNITGNVGIFKWPYEIKYKEEKRITTDVLIIGAGMAGCFCAIHAARRGAKVTLVEKRRCDKIGSKRGRHRSLDDVCGQSGFKVQGG